MAGTAAKRPMQLSPSSRRAWIEIRPTYQTQFGTSVALLAEGVDRNMSQLRLLLFHFLVALLAEGVDRNLSGVFHVGFSEGRPPRGGRG